jgi:hypothetical protein
MTRKLLPKNQSVLLLGVPLELAEDQLRRVADVHVPEGLAVRKQFDCVDESALGGGYCTSVCWLRSEMRPS